jgi:phosphonate transport system substrate-binding protein
MGPWGYVLANAEGGGQAIAMFKYDGKPFYHASRLSPPAAWPGVG